MDTYIEEEEDLGNPQEGWMEERLIKAFNMMAQTTGSVRKAYRTFDNPTFRQSMHIPLALWKALGSRLQAEITVIREKENAKFAPPNPVKKQQTLAQVTS